MVNPLVLLDLSAMPAEIKKTALTQEVVRIRRNIQPGLPWKITVKHLEDVSQCLRASGYREDYRHQVIKFGVQGFYKMMGKSKIRGRPIIRASSWETDTRERNKELKSKIPVNGYSLRKRSFIMD